MLGWCAVGGVVVLGKAVSVAVRAHLSTFACAGKFTRDRYNWRRSDRYYMISSTHTGIADDTLALAHEHAINHSLYAFEGTL